MPRTSYYRRRRTNYRYKKNGMSNGNKPWYDRPIQRTPMQLALQTAQYAAKGVSYIKGLVNAEVYKYDFATNFSPTTTGAVTNCVSIAQGDGITTRTGNSLFVRSVDINFTIAYNTLATGVGQIVRSWLIEDTQQVGDTAPAFTDIFDNQDVRSHLNANTVGRFKVLDSRIYNVSSDKPRIFIHFRKDMRHHVRYNGTGSGDFQKGGIYWVVVSDQGSNPPSVTYNGRTSYHDN